MTKDDEYGTAITLLYFGYDRICGHVAKEMMGDMEEMLTRWQCLRILSRPTKQLQNNANSSAVI